MKPKITQRPNNRKAKMLAESNFSSEELNKIKGLNSKDLYKTLGYASEEEAIHRNNLVIS